jgi:class 3 adenylate cyclase
VGTVTFLFTDLEGSTRLLEAHPEAYRDAVRRHHDLLLGAVEAHGGAVFETLGDAVYAAFARPTAAGHAINTPAFLTLYDPLVLGFFGPVVWRCPTSRSTRARAPLHVPRRVSPAAPRSVAPDADGGPGRPASDPVPREPST